MHTSIVVLFVIMANWEKTEMPKNRGIIKYSADYSSLWNII